MTIQSLTTLLLVRTRTDEVPTSWSCKQSRKQMQEIWEGSFECSLWKNTEKEIGFHNSLDLHFWIFIDFLLRLDSFNVEIR